MSAVMVLMYKRNQASCYLLQEANMMLRRVKSLDLPENNVSSLPEPYTNNIRMQKECSVLSRVIFIHYISTKCLKLFTVITLLIIVNGSDQFAFDFCIAQYNDKGFYCRETGGAVLFLF